MSRVRPVVLTPEFYGFESFLNANFPIMASMLGKAALDRASDLTQSDIMQPAATWQQLLDALTVDDVEVDGGCALCCARCVVSSCI